MAIQRSQLKLTCDVPNCVSNVIVENVQQAQFNGWEVKGNKVTCNFCRVEASLRNIFLLNEHFQLRPDTFELLEVQIQTSGCRLEALPKSNRGRKPNAAKATAATDAPGTNGNGSQQAPVAPTSDLPLDLMASPSTEAPSPVSASAQAPALQAVQAKGRKR